MSFVIIMPGPNAFMSMHVFSQKRIVDEANLSRSFTVIADEATDSATLEQLSISIRYINSEVICFCSYVLYLL